MLINNNIINILYEKKKKMRIRFKPWAREELETSPFYIDNPQMFKNRWKTAFENDYPIYLELGCGKGN